MWFLAAVFIYTAVFSGPIMLFQRRSVAAIVEWLDRRDEPDLDEQTLHAAFAASMRFPLRSAVIGLLNWLLPTWIVCFAMELRWERWNLFDSAVVLFSGVAAGFLAGSFLILLGKIMIAPMRNALAVALPDAAVRRSLVVPLRLRTKLLVCVTGVTIMPVIFAVLLAHTEATRSLRDFTIRWQNAMLDVARQRLAAGADLEEPVAGDVARLPVPIEVGVVDFASASGRGLGAKLEHEIAASVEQAVARGEASGDSARLRGPQVFSGARCPTDGSCSRSRPPSASSSTSPRFGPSLPCCWWCRRGWRRCWRGCWRRT